MKNYEKLDELRIHILACSVWWSIMKDDKFFCKMVTEVTGLEIERPLNLFPYMQLYSDKNKSDIEDRLVSRYYT